MKAFVLASLLLLSNVANAYHVNFNSQKIAHIVGEIDTQTQFRFEMEMESTRDIPGDRLILIDSPGGYVEAGQRMLEVLDVERARGVKAVCVVMGEASSMAFDILTHCDVRLAAPNSHMTVHKIAISQWDTNARGTAANLRREADELDQIDEPYRKANAKAMHLTLREYDRYADQETSWTASILLQRGYLQGILHGNE